MKLSLMTDIPGIGSGANWGKILALFKRTDAGWSPLGGYLADRFSRRQVIAPSLVSSATTYAVNYNAPDVTFSPNAAGQNVDANFGRILGSLEARRTQLGSRRTF